MLTFLTAFLLIASGLSPLVESQECPTFTLPNNTRWLDADVNGQGSKFKCAEGYRTMGQSSCVNGEWDISPVCVYVDPCNNNPCLNGGTCVNGSCTCPTGYYGKICKGCEVRKNSYMNFPNIKMYTSFQNSKEECENKCSENPECNVVGYYSNAYGYRLCQNFRFPMVQYDTDTTLEKCIEACYNNTRCNGFNYHTSQDLLTNCEMFNTTAGVSFTLSYETVYSTSAGACDELFKENQ